MKILNLIQCANLGGMEQASLRLMRALRAQGHELQLVSLNPIGGLRQALEAENIPHVGLPYAGKGGWRILRRLRRVLKASEANALLMTGPHLLSMLTLGEVAKGRRILAVHFHHENVKPTWQWRMIYRCACSRFQAITFPSDYLRLEAERIYPPVAALAHTVRNPLVMPVRPTKEQTAAARKLLGLPVAGPIIGNAGWLIPRKRFDVFLQTAALIAARCPQARFVIAGDGEERQKLRDLAARLNLTDRLTWTGWIQNLEDFYRSLDVLLFNSDSDAFATTPQEAMSYYVPVVASVVHGGLKEILSSSDFGFLIDRHQPEVLADAVMNLLEHPAAANQISLAGRQHLQLFSDPATIARQHEKLWRL